MNDVKLRFLEAQSKLGISHTYLTNTVPGKANIFDILILVEELQKLLYSLVIVTITILQKVEHDLNPHWKEIQISLVEKKISLDEK
jgi:hypothetical protein